MEYAFFSYFQKLCLVPLRIKNLIEIQENVEGRRKEYCTNQFGYIVFTNEMHTSIKCPYCEETLKRDTSDKDKLKFIQHRYLSGKHKDSECKQEKIQ